MAYRVESRICANVLCRAEFVTKERSVFCSRSCAQSQNNRGRKQTETQKLHTSEALKKYFAKHPRPKGQRSDIIHGAKTSRGRFNSNPQSLAELSKRTISKIFKRLGVGCSKCGWNKAICDLHHIRGRNIPNPHHHSNLTYLCPNCHREFHVGLFGPADVMTLEAYIGDRWKEFYYG